MRRGVIAAGLLVPTACAPVATPPVQPPPVLAAPAMPTIGLERVMGQNAAGLAALFGKPDAEVREGTARKLQYAGRFCVLDAYLYPKDGGEPRVTYLDAREPDGSPIDRASCIAALTRREGGR